MNQPPAAPHDEYLASACAAASVRTASLRAAFRLTDAESEDIQQTLILKLLTRRAAFDDSKGAVNTFTGAVSANLAADIANDLSRDRRFFESRPQWQDGANDPDFRGGFDELGEFADNVIPMWTDPVDRFAEADLSYDIAAAEACMSGEQLDLCRLLASHQDLPSAAKASGMSSASFYRRIEDLRMHMRMFGIRPAA